MNGRTSFPSGPAGLLLIAVAFAPLAIKKCKPAIKFVGETLERAGKTVQRIAEESAART